MATIHERRVETFEETLQLLHNYGKVMIIRPMSFGKTVLLIKLMQQYDRVLFLYPTDIIRQRVYSSLGDTVDYMSYLALARGMFPLGQYDLIVCDECHRLGGEKTAQNLHRLLEAQQNCHFVGATGTPDRSDFRDIADEFFDNIITSEYTLHDAFSERVIYKPWYSYMTYDFETDIRKRMTGVDEKEISARVVEASRLFNLSNIIREDTEKAIKDTNYMKFILFFSSIKALRDNTNKVIGYFKAAFPNKEFRVLSVTSDKEDKGCLNQLKHFTHKDNTVDLILSVDMLNMGYHIPDITGVGLFRCTSSSIVFLQQLGRCLSADDDKPKIVFDFVDVIDRPAIYQVGKRKRRGNRISAIDKIFDIEEEDLIATGHVASYKKFLKKCSEEPYKNKCKRAYNKFVEMGGLERGRGATIEFYAMWQRVRPEDVIAYAQANGFPVEPVA